MKTIECDGYTFVQDQTFTNRYYCKTLDTTIARQGDDRTRLPWCAYRGSGLSGKSEWFEDAKGQQRVFGSAPQCAKAVVKEWSR